MVTVISKRYDNTNFVNYQVGFESSCQNYFVSCPTSFVCILIRNSGCYAALQNPFRMATSTLVTDGRGLQRPTLS